MDRTLVERPAGTHLLFHSPGGTESHARVELATPGWKPGTSPLRLMAQNRSCLGRPCAVRAPRKNRTCASRVSTGRSTTELEDHVAGCYRTTCKPGLWPGGLIRPTPCAIDGTCTRYLHLDRVVPLLLRLRKHVFSYVVGMAGIEPATSRVQTQRPTNSPHSVG